MGLETDGGRGMTDLPGIVITGAAGRMGQMLLRTVLASDKARLAGALVRPGHALLGQDVGVSLGLPACGVAYTDDPLPLFATAQAVIDFTTPEATLHHAMLAAQGRVVHVVGTTGMSDSDIAAIGRAAHHAVVVRSGNMSLGVNLLAGITETVARALDAGWDIEVVEAHHSRKVDAPSGTALLLGEAAAKGRGADLADLRTPGREGITGARVAGTIGFSAIRGGDIVGEHDVIFAGPGERIVLRHMATDRAIFAKGALAAALWGIGQKPGHYDMQDVLGMK
jgi:4-hydroxy-tetrahydrodipicolinate reductase